MSKLKGLALLILCPIFIFAQEGGAPNKEATDKKEKETPVPAAKYFYKFPKKVDGVLRDSIVSVKTINTVVTLDGQVHGSESNGSGFVAFADNYVLTAAHLMRPPVNDLVVMMATTDWTVFDGKTRYVADDVMAFPDGDLVLLKVCSAPGQVKFSKKPVTFPLQKDFKKFPKNFYIFRMMADRDENMQLRVGPYLMETFQIDENKFKEPFGVLQGPAEHGFSGGPLVGSNGKVYGSISMTTSAFCYASTLDNIDVLRRLFESHRAKKPTPVK